MDQKTLSYFNHYTPKYSIKKFDNILYFLNKYGKKNDSLIDIGCGNGELLLLIEKKTRIKKLHGIDTSSEYMKQAKKKISCKIYKGSILDNQLVLSLEEKFDFAIMSAVLHHLIGKNRKESRNQAQKAIKNALKLVKNNSYIIILEPLFSSVFFSTIIFYLKKFFSFFYAKRIEIFGKWNNIGAPIVSYYSLSEIKDIVKSNNKINIIKIIKNPEKNKLLNLLGIKKTNIVFILKKKH